jgi:hypothetical protein
MVREFNTEDDDVGLKVLEFLTSQPGVLDLGEFGGEVADEWEVHFRTGKQRTRSQ